MFSSTIRTFVRRGFMSGVGALALTASMSMAAGSAFAAGSGQIPSPVPHHCLGVDWNCVVQGRGDGFDRGDTAGYRIWHNQNEDSHWYVETTDQQGVSHEYTGTLTTDGTFVNLTSVRPEKDDQISQTGTGTIAFDLKTYSGVDGLRFSIDGGRHLTMNLSIDGQPAPTGEIFLGDHNVNPTSNPLTFTR